MKIKFANLRPSKLIGCLAWNRYKMEILLILDAELQVDNTIRVKILEVKNNKTWHGTWTGEEDFEDTIFLDPNNESFQIEGFPLSRDLGWSDEIDVR